MNPSSSELQVYRKVFRAAASDIDQFIQTVQQCRTDLNNSNSDYPVVLAAVYRYGRMIYAYFETTDKNFTPDEILAPGRPWLVEVPGHDAPRYWIELMDIHHWHQPASLDQWRRKEPVQQRMGMLNKLKPEKVSSYVYYHYLVQEAKPGSNNKYVSIYLDENYIFMFVELPSVIEPVDYLPTLNGDDLPVGPAWHQLMEQHFDNLPETENQDNVFWHTLEMILELDFQPQLAEPGE